MIIKKQLSVLGKHSLISAPSSPASKKMKPTKSLESILDEWQNETGITDEQKYGRQEAAKRIRACANNKSTTLNLYKLRVGSLPAGVFEHLTQLTYLNLNQNQLSTLPKKSIYEFNTVKKP